MTGITEVVAYPHIRLGKGIILGLENMRVLAAVTAMAVGAADDGTGRWLEEAPDGKTGHQLVGLADDRVEGRITGGKAEPLVRVVHRPDRQGWIGAVLADKTRGKLAGVTAEADLVFVLGRCDRRTESAETPHTCKWSVHRPG